MIEMSGLIDYVREAWENSKPRESGKKRYVARSRIRSPAGELLYILFVIMVPASIFYFHSDVLLYLSLGFSLSLIAHETYKEERALTRDEKKKRPQGPGKRYADQEVS